MKRMIVVVFLALAGLVPLANGQWQPIVAPGGWNSALNRAMAGPNMVNGMWRAQQDPYGYQYSSYGNGGGRVGAAIGGAMTGAMIGGIAGGRNGALIGAGGGVLAGVVIASYRGGGHPLAGPGNSRNSGGDFALTNQTRFSIEVWFGKGKGKYLGRLASGETWSVKGPKPGEKYSGYALIPNGRGGLSNDEVPIQPTPDGWTFVEPDCVRQGGR